MGYDNRLLSINGQSDDQLKLALQVAFMDQYGSNTCKGWEFNPEKGLVLYQYYSDSRKDVNKFPAPMTHEDVFPIVKNWLKSDDAKKVPCGQWEDDLDHDGSNITGFHVYVEDWGHVGGQWGTLCAIKRVYLWLGK